jgi:hypothetical protein
MGSPFKRLQHFNRETRFAACDASGFFAPCDASSVFTLCDITGFVTGLVILVAGFACSFVVTISGFEIVSLLLTKALTLEGVFGS